MSYIKWPISQPFVYESIFLVVVVFFMSQLDRNCNACYDVISNWEGFHMIRIGQNLKTHVSCFLLIILYQEGQVIKWHKQTVGLVCIKWFFSKLPFLHTSSFLPSHLSKIQIFQLSKPDEHWADFFSLNFSHFSSIVLVFLHLALLIFAEGGQDISSWYLLVSHEQVGLGSFKWGKR